MADKNLSRIRRQFDAIVRFAPPARRIITPLMQNGMRWLRVPISVLLLAGGILAFLPVFGRWMLPLGLLLLAVDIPVLRPAVATGSIWARRRARRFTRRRKGTGAHR
jgi:hypothetical protein